MAWFKVDDKFHTSEPVKRIPRSERMGAIGLWTLAGSWSADHLKDGYVPAFMIEELGGTTRQADALVTVKLWRKVRDGYRFTEWEEWQPTREQVETNRRAERDRKAEYRRRKAEESGAHPSDVPPGHDAESGSPRPVPTRPDLKDDDPTSGGNSRAQHHRSGRTGDNPVETVDEAGIDASRIAAVVHELTGTSVHPLIASSIAEHYLERAKQPPRMPTRYVVRCLRSEEPLVLENYLATERWSA